MTKKVPKKPFKVCKVSFTKDELEEYENKEDYSPNIMKIIPNIKILFFLLSNF